MFSEILIQNTHTIYHEGGLILQPNYSINIEFKIGEHLFSSLCVCPNIHRLGFNEEKNPYGVEPI